ncbi:MAG TPA: lasso peptide biosynthesis B2 protein [Steroidobacteraceae bacterium]|nr:lasso peptide biosynthesis B2 protein [Steroidobacteraceae bacterium]
MSAGAINLEPLSCSYWLPAHVFACWQTTAVLLDLKRNRYFGLPLRESAELMRLLHRGGAVIDDNPSDGSQTLAHDLLESGLLVRESPTTRITPATVHLDGELTSFGYERRRHVAVRSHHLANHARAYVWARFAVSLRSFYSVACEVSNRKHATSHAGTITNTEQLLELVSVFQELRALTFTSKDKCLFHALALTRFLSLYDVFPTWALGVCTTPWAAHSWVQHGNLLLDATPEQVVNFTPILCI